MLVGVKEESKIGLIYCVALIFIAYLSIVEEIFSTFCCHREETEV